MSLFGKKTDIKPLQDEIPVPLVTITPSGNILYANTAAKKFFQSDNLVNSKITDFIKSDLPTMLDGSGSSLRKSFKTYGENEKYVEISAKESITNHHFIMTFVDVTQDYILQQSLIKHHKDNDNLSKNKNRFLAQMSNVLKSPIYSVMGYSQAILEGMGGGTDERQRKYLEIIYKDTADLFKLLDNITELSKIETGLFELSYKNFDVMKILNQIYEEYSSKMKEKGLDFIINTDDLVQKVLYGDENILKQIIKYLLNSAIISSSFGTVRLILSDREFTENNQHKINIKILDAGTKIKQDELATVLNPYYQPDKKHRATLIRSLNICIAGNLIKSLNGSYTTETENAGFSVVLPTDKTVEKLLKVD